MPAAPRLADRVCVVTGASSGLGAAIAAALAAEGAAVVGLARRFAEGAPTPPVPGRVSERRCDVRDLAQVRAVFAALPQVDVLVNNAGQVAGGAVVDANLDDVRAMLETHVLGAFACAQEALRKMAPRRRGHIVNVGSIVGWRTFPGQAGYTAAKEALRGFTRVLAEEARALGVRVTGFHPGATDTPAWDGAPFDRADMMAPAKVAELVVEVLARPELSVEELVVYPPKGVL